MYRLKEKRMNTKKVILYTTITLITSWISQSVLSIYFMQHQDMTGKTVFQVGLAAMMFLPAIVAIILNKGFKGFGWKPKFKGCGWLIPVCMFAPGIMVIIGAALFFLFFPDFLDFGGSYMIAQGEQMGVDFASMLAEKGMTMQTYYIITVLAGFFYGPAINMFVALGEEVGWRGFLYPQLNKKFNRVTTWIIGGVIWASFHFPCMAIAGYEYGFDYPGFPFVGWIVFTVTCIVLGAFEEMVYHKSKCIWYPALLHGAVNATTFILMFINVNQPDYGKLMILGPAVNGAISMIPGVILAVVLGIVVMKKSKKETEA